MSGKQIKKHDKLTDSIQEMYRDKGRVITDDEAKEASINLTGFFKLLMEIDRENKGIK